MVGCPAILTDLPGVSRYSKDSRLSWQLPLRLNGPGGAIAVRRIDCLADDLLQRPGSRSR